MLLTMKDQRKIGVIQAVMDGRVKGLIFGKKGAVGHGPGVQYFRRLSFNFPERSGTTEGWA